MQHTPVPVATAVKPGPRLLRHLRLEDLLLLAWLVVRPLVAPDAQDHRSIAGYDPIGGLFDLVALCGAAACLAARRQDATHTGLIRDQEIAYAVGPLFGAVAFAIEDCASRLGLTGGAETLALVIPIGAAIVARLQLSPTTATQRRALVTPFILAASGFFGDFLSGSPVSSTCAPSRGRSPRGQTWPSRCSSSRWGCWER